MKPNQGFTLIELLIVIGIIAILASAIVVAINPGVQFAQARDTTRQKHLSSMNSAILSHMVSNFGNLSDLGINHIGKEICALDAPDCEGLIDLSPLVEGGYISGIALDSTGGVDPNGTGYFISQVNNTVSLSSYNNETRNVGIGPCPPTFKDFRDGHIYRTVQIGNQCWMAENLKTTQYANGDPIPYVDNTESGNVTWVGLSTGAYSIYPHTSGGFSNKEEMVAAYGLLYNGYVAKDHRGVCPDGWRVSTDNDWLALELYSGMNEIGGNKISGWRHSGNVGKKLKYIFRNPSNQSASHPRWNYDATHFGINYFGFSALPSGHRNNSTGGFNQIGTYSIWWSYDGDISIRRHVFSGYSGVYRDVLDQRFGISLRCIKI